MQEPEGRYANHFQVAYNSNEFLIDFGQDFGDKPPQLHTRIVMNSTYLELFLELIRKTAADWRNAGEGRE